MARLRMTIDLEYDADDMYGPGAMYCPDAHGAAWFFGTVLGAGSGLALTSMELGGDIVGTVQVISAVEVSE